MIENVFDPKRDVARLSHKKGSKDKKKKRDPKIRVEYKETRINAKNKNTLKTKRQG